MRAPAGNGEAWRLYRGDELVGEICDMGVDMFWLGGRFVPVGPFELELRGLFVDASEGLAAGDFERSADASRQILESLWLADPRGVVVSLFNIVIEGDRARFRLQ
ncbi:hypothetical protein ACPPVO_35045 [Dactylosporangium sp. McL0621]|uniref:hypothetical protein n=1 Tax=Dactylosporangium sp. McL0621 TaxID=3415678 RepID=UPI003CEC0CDE